MKYRYKTRPYRHQVAALKKLLSTGWGGALLMAPRTGKTKVCIDYASALHAAGKVNRVLVVCPVSVIEVWVDEINAHCPVRHRVTVWDREGRKEKTLPRFGQDLLDFVVVNYDAFSVPGDVRSRDSYGNLKRSKSKGGRFTAKKKLVAWSYQLMILDESHRIKSPSAKKTRMIRTLGERAEYRVIATGTAVTKKKRIFDVYSQWKFLNPKSPLVQGMTLSDFKRYYGVWLQRNGYEQWLRNRHVSELRRHLHADSFAITREECFDLPKRRNQIIPVTLDRSAGPYAEMAEEMIAMLKSGEITEASIRLVQILRLAQITSGFAKTTPTPQHPRSRLVRVGKEKLEVMENLLSDLFEAEEKVVVGARFRADIAAIVRVCSRLKVPAFELHGGITRAERSRNILDFRKLEGPGLFVMQPAAGSLGIDLSTASIFIWYSLTTSWVDFTQAEDRVALSPRKTVFMYLLATGTIDEIMHDSLMEDGNVAKAITESPDRLLRNFKR